MRQAEQTLERPLLDINASNDLMHQLSIYPLEHFTFLKVKDPSFVGHKLGKNILKS